MSNTKKSSCYHQILNTLNELKKKYPSYNIGRHISTALSDYPDLWSLSDKEILFAIEKYSAELEFNRIDDDDAFLKKVIEDADHIFDEVDPSEVEEEEI